jgi:hypothetical protein
MDFSVIQYADDTLSIMPAEMDQLRALKEVLHKFTLSTSLKINYGKSQLVPINVFAELTASLASEFGCQVGSMSFTY